MLLTARSLVPLLLLGINKVTPSPIVYLKDGKRYRAVITRTGEPLLRVVETILIRKLRTQDDVDDLIGGLAHPINLLF